MNINRDLLARLPKVELHRHMEGAIPVEFFQEVADEFSIDVPGGKDAIPTAIAMEEPIDDFPHFLGRFEFMRNFYINEEIIRRATRAAIKMAHEDGIFFLELRYNPMHFANKMAFNVENVIQWVTEARDEAASEFDIHVDLIATLNRRDGASDAIPIINAAIEGEGYPFTGIDVAGNEKLGSLMRFAGILRRASSAGLGITIHAGEIGPAAHIKEAITVLGADRIGHGIAILDDPEIVELAKSKGTTFEVCPSSNYMTGTVNDLDQHPILKMAEQELHITLNTDDPVIFSASLTEEYARMIDIFNFGLDDLLALNQTAIESSFRPSQERAELLDLYNTEFERVAKEAN